MGISPSKYFRSTFKNYLYLFGAYGKFLTSGMGMGMPFIVQIQTQSFCNGRCTICPYPLIREGYEHGHMTQELYEKIVSELGSGSSPHVVTLMLHNEPLLDEGIFNRVKYLKVRRPRTDCAIVTNGELLDGFKQSDIVDSRLDHLRISMNAYTEETFKQINTGIDFGKVMDNIHVLLPNSSLRKRVYINYVVTEQNKHEVKIATKYWKRHGIGVRLLRVSNRAGALDHFSTIYPGRIYYEGPFYFQIWRRLVHLVGGVTGCPLPFFQMNILFNGDVILCCHDWHRATILGNVMEATLDEIWNSPKANEIRKKILAKQYSEIEACRNCNLAR